MCIQFFGPDKIFSLFHILWLWLSRTFHINQFNTLKHLNFLQWNQKQASFFYGFKQSSVKRIAIQPSNPTAGHTHRGNWKRQNWKRIERDRIERDTCTPMFIAALFTIARTWKQPRCPSADEWIRKLWYIYTMKYYPAIKKNAFESVLMRWMKLEGYDAERCKTERKTPIQYTNAYIWNLERW